MTCPTCPARRYVNSYGLSAKTSTCTSDRCNSEEGAPCQQPGADPRTGSVLQERYVLCELLVQGDQGAVYSAQAIQFPKKFAVKLLPEEISLRPEAIDTIRNPNLVPIIDVFTLATGETALVMPLIHGSPLIDFIDRGGALQADEVLELGAQIASVLLSLHQHDLIYGDLHPGNILVEELPSGGLFAHVLQPNWRRAEHDYYMTTDLDQLRFASPEEVLGQAPDQRSNSYTLGALLHLMAYGKPTFEHQERSVLKDAITTGAPMPVGTDQTPLKWWLASLMARDPRRRPANMRILRRQLEQLRRELRSQPSMPIGHAEAENSDTTVPPINQQRNHGHHR